ncbi:hypothetical protein ABZ714_26155 [Streptomyces sp. NPDC006798]|uniref:hypothetical protein n=1 Tax=Streptomyces sp. NPDC006798 TaxID=3155462 RepID=UPI0033C98D03
MITEPELVGGDEPERPRAWHAGPGERVPDGDPAEHPPAEDVTHGGEGGGSRWRAPGKGWQWALGGALLASVLWAGGLYAYSATTDGDPDTGPYRAVDDLCQVATLPKLTEVLGEKAPTRFDEEYRHPARDQSVCNMELVLKPGEVPAGLTTGNPAQDDLALTTNVMIVYTLHKKTDPGPEFDAAVAAEAKQMTREPERLEGLGERAYLIDDDGMYTTLHILDGQAVIELTSDTYRTEKENGNGVAQPVKRRGPLIEDARTLLKELRSGRG